MIAGTGGGMWLELVVGGAAESVDAFYSGRRAAIAAAPGVGSVRRYREPGGPRHLLVAQLEDVDAAATYLRSVVAQSHPLDDCPAPQARALVARSLPEAVHGIAQDGVEGALKLMVVMAVNAACEEEYNRWYDTEHIPILLRHDGWLGARRYRCDSPVPEYVTVYEVAHDRILTAHARADVRSTEWSREVLGRAFVTHTRAFFADVTERSIR